MIYSNISDWKDLQNKVCELLNDVGLIAEKEKTINTPRGNIELDVYAIDPLSIDKIKYVIECKNWNNKVPQTVIHSFTTVMAETGGNIGYIISKKGFQSGSLEYVKSTNIKLFNFEEFQNHYLEMWLNKVFYTKIYTLTEYLSGYTEPINNRREKYVAQLITSNKKAFLKLYEYYQPLSIILLTASNSENRIFRKGMTKEILELKYFVHFFKQEYNITIKSKNYTQLLIELEEIINSVTEEFNTVFGKNIFL